MHELEGLRDEYKKQGYGLIRYDDGPVHSYPYDAPWVTDAAFGAIYDRMRNHTLVDRNRCWALYLLCRQVESVPGDVLEVGTWRGGTAGILTSALPNKTVHVADTFEGVVKAADWEHYSDRAHDDTSVEVVEQLLRLDLGVSNYRILKGIFPEQTGGLLVGRALALVYLDVDVYHSTKDAFEYVWPTLSPFGIVAFDDYGFVSACGGIKRFVDEISGDDDKIFLQNMNGQAYVIKKY
jgi:O-methyltransferase